MGDGTSQTSFFLCASAALREQFFRQAWVAEEVSRKGAKTLSFLIKENGRRQQPPFICPTLSFARAGLRGFFFRNAAQSSPAFLRVTKAPFLFIVLSARQLSLRRTKRPSSETQMRLT